MESGALTTFLVGNLLANQNVASEDMAAAQAYIDSVPAIFDRQFEQFDLQVHSDNGGQGRN